MAARVHSRCGPLVCFPLLQGLLTLRLARSDLSSRLESATGRFGAYPDRTCTCENYATFRTHHADDSNQHILDRKYRFRYPEIKESMLLDAGR